MLRIALLAVVIAMLPVAASGKDKVLNILYTGAIKGELEPCGCSPETQSGGLARLSGLVSGQGSELSPFVLVDAGNSEAADTAQGRLKTEALLKSFAAIGYDAAAFFGRSAAVPGGKVKALSAGGAGSALVERGGVKVNISVDPKARRAGALNILLSERPSSELAVLAGWDIAITSSGEELDGALEAGGPIVVAGFPRGQRLGVLSIRLGPKGRPVVLSQSWRMLGSDVDEDAAVRAILNEYDSKVAALADELEKKAARGGPYVGALSCAECHQPFSASWEATRHAGALHTLERAGKPKDPECVKCHTTGYGEPGGYVGMAATPGLSGVQCEACHGPGREHALDFTPMRQIDEGVCLRCHNESNSPLFDYRKYLDRVNHKEIER